MIPSYRKDSLEQHYKKLYELGKGGMGTTYAAEDVNTGKKVALKVIYLHNQTDAKSLELLEREVTVLKKLNHPNIPQYIDYFQLEDDNKLYLVQELVPGKNLNQQVEEGLRLIETEVKDIAVQVLSILDYLHNFDPRIIHRDIKPHNLIISDDGQIFLVDFGAVHNAYYNTVIGGTVGIGTIGYMSPEQQIGKPVPASDLYSLGRTLLYLLTRRPPDHLLPHKETVNLEVIGDYIQLSDEFLGWLEKILEPDVDERFYSAKEALKGLKNPKLVNEGKLSKIRCLTWLCLCIACVSVPIFYDTFKKNKWLILNSLGFPAPAKVCFENDITKEYFKSVGKLTKDNYNWFVCKYFLKNVLLGLSEGDNETIKLLIEHGVDLDFSLTDGEPTTLELIVWRGGKDKQIIQSLINRNGGVHFKDRYGYTPLHYAAQLRDKEIAELLINSGARINVKNEYGQTPLNYARRKRNKEIIQLLKKHGAR